LKARTVSDLKPWERNPRKISAVDLEALKRSLREFGDLGGIVVNKRTGHVVGGHQRIKGLDPSWRIERHPARDKTGTVAIGYITTPSGRLSYREVDWPQRREVAANLAANKIQGEWDTEKLADILKELRGGPEADLTGFSEREVEQIISTLGIDASDAEDRIPADIEDREGLWSCGQHRLLCADATTADSWTRLMGEKKAALMVTDPPYCVEYDVAHKSTPMAGIQIPHQSRGELTGDDTISTALNVVEASRPFLIPEWSAYVFCGTKLGIAICNRLDAASIHHAPFLVWRKQNPVVSWSRYHYDHELVLWFGPGSRPGGHARWFGPKDERSVWEVPLDVHGDRLHPTQKPVAIFERPIMNGSGHGEIVVDPCIGSGTSLIAAEKTGRVCYGMDVNPACVGMAVKRWETFTGKKAEKLK
jgi:DNA modification methylase